MQRTPPSAQRPSALTRASLSTNSGSKRKRPTAELGGLMSDFIGDRECVTHHACDCIRAEQERFKALRKGLEGEVERLRNWRYEAADVTAPDNIADRLRELLESSGGK